MNSALFRWPPLVGTVLLATLLWGVTFYSTWGNFWLKISFSAALLAVLSLWLPAGKKMRLKFDTRSFLMGLSSAAVLYLIFWAGKHTSRMLFPFAEYQIGSIYDKGQGTPVWLIAGLLLFLTGPCEELYWRGYLQHNLMQRLGNRQGFLWTTIVYAGVHVWSFNLMLIGAAAVAGAFWGLMYWRWGNLAPVIVSHAIWSAVIFTFLPMS
ncbi:MAG: type II CAAX endopeptidase family protein [Desulfobacterales bacterium]|nr:type II CAAX endopeptidase family protein [Desulfobacterales bacterium]